MEKVVSKTAFAIVMNYTSHREATFFFFLQARVHIYIGCCVQDCTSAANYCFYNTEKLSDWKAQLLACLFLAEACLSEYSQIYSK